MVLGAWSRPPSVSGVPWATICPADDHGDAIGEPLGLVHVVRGQEDRLAELAEVVDHVPGCPSRRGIEAGCRLVEEDQLGVADQGEPEVEPAPLAAGEARGLPVVLAGEADERDRLGHRSGVAVVAGVELERLADGEPGIGRGLLQDDPDPVAPGARSVGRVDAEHRHLSIRPGAEPFQDLDRGRLAGAVRAEEGEDLSALDLEGDPADGFGLGVALAEVAYADRRLALGCLPDGFDWAHLVSPSGR